MNEKVKDQMDRVLNKTLSVLNIQYVLFFATDYGVTTNNQHSELSAEFIMHANSKPELDFFFNVTFLETTEVYKFQCVLGWPGIKYVHDTIYVV